LRTQIRKTIGLTLASFGAFGFLSGFVLSAGGSQFNLRNIDFPAGDLGDAVQDSNGVTYLALAFYGRIQAYDSLGSFLRGWSAQAEGGSIRLGLTSNGQVASYADRRGSTLVFDTDGQVVAELPDDENNSDSVLARTLMPQVFDINPAISPGFWFLRPVAGPFPAFLIFMAGLFVFWGGAPRFPRRNSAA
jgi:hypothetical protein